MMNTLKFTATICLIVIGLSLKNLNAQGVPPTSEDEYTYGTVGYKMELQMKLPHKKGYDIKDAGVYEEADRKLTFKAVYRDKETRPCCIILVYSLTRSAPEYFCLPTADAPQEMWKKFFESLRSENENPEMRFKFMAKGITRLAAINMQ